MSAVRPVLSLVPAPPAVDTFDARRQAMLRAWNAALPAMTAEERQDEIDATANAMRQMGALHG